MSRWHFIFQCFPSESPSLRCFSLSSSSAPPGSSGTHTRDPCPEQPSAAPPLPQLLLCLAAQASIYLQIPTSFLPFFPPHMPGLPRFVAWRAGWRRMERVRVAGCCPCALLSPTREAGWKPRGSALQYLVVSKSASTWKMMISGTGQRCCAWGGTCTQVCLQRSSWPCCSIALSFPYSPSHRNSSYIIVPRFSTAFVAYPLLPCSLPSSVTPYCNQKEKHRGITCTNKRMPELFGGPAGCAHA